jgi:hypothetical protein
MTEFDKAFAVAEYLLKENNLVALWKHVIGFVVAWLERAFTTSLKTVQLKGVQCITFENSQSISVVISKDQQVLIGKMLALFDEKIVPKLVAAVGDKSPEKTLNYCNKSLKETGDLFTMKICDCEVSLEKLKKSTKKAREWFEKSLGLNK